MFLYEQYKKLFLLKVCMIQLTKYVVVKIQELEWYLPLIDGSCTDLKVFNAWIVAHI